MADGTPTLAEIAARIDRSAIRRLLVDRLGGVGVGYASLVRVAGFVVVWLLLLGLLIPTPEVDTASLFVNQADATPDEIVRSVTLDRRDERGFAVTPATEDLRVAWVGGSTLQEVSDGGGFRFIPGLMAEDLRMEDGSAVDVDVYFLEATRVVDTYVATLEAIAREPDVLIVTLNPALVLNGAAIQTWDNLDGLLTARGVAHPGVLPLAAALASPSDAAWGLVGRHFDAIEGRWHWSDRLNARATVGGLLDSPVDADGDERDALDTVAAMSLPIDFWISNGGLTTVGSKLARQLALLEASRAYDDRLNVWVLGSLGDAIVDAEIPTIVYVPPAQRGVDGAAWVDTELADVSNRLEALRPRFEGPLVRFAPQPLALPLDELDHADLFHVRNGAPVAAAIGEMLCSLLDTVGRVACAAEASS